MEDIAMALIRFAEGQQRSGSLGATVYSHGRYGPYVRARSVPVNPSTDRQVTARGALQSLSIRWNNTLTQAKRDAWEVYSGNVIWRNALGDTTYLTGLAHYIRCNSVRILVGLAVLDDAPTTFTLATPEQELVVTASEAAQTLSAAFDDTADWALEVGGFQAFYMGLPKNPSIKFFGGPWRFMVAVLGEAAKNAKPPEPGEPVAAASPKLHKAKALLLPETGGSKAVASPEADIPTPDWPFAEGQRIWVRSRIGRADGRLSEFAQTNFLAVA